MKRFVVALVVAHLLSISYVVAWYIDEQWTITKAQYFIKKSVSAMEHAWYLKYITSHIVSCVTYICFAFVASKYSRRLYLVVSLFGLYHLVDFIIFFYDFGQSWWLYWTLMGAIIGGIVLLFIPVKEKARIVHLDE